MRVAALVLGVVLTAGAAGCGAVVPGTPRLGAVPSTDRALITAYVEASNRAGDGGPAAQTDFLRSTQAEGAPFPPDRCFGEVTLDTRLVQRTLRPDADWTPPATLPNVGRPAGAIYVAAAAVSVRRGAVEVREDVGSKHFVVRDARVFSYAPCAD
ncbi:hypothetical protein [Actinomycetospora termitidis]|uniref:Lipoprotein n=1 Tax=Actinomycetospora termitidis TaxID=3053470 RepID=A0ABT7M374_9PSEU|nr:hypothetical protein [Actinomycetospora sp. Odt1-22]MDL5155118.1 hypothetical protein [Actinomycetospora sp. Odt1-22]